MKKNKSYQDLVIKILKIDKDNNLSPLDNNNYFKYICDNNYYIKEDKGIIKGYIFFRNFENYVEIIRIAVLDKYRRAGIATGLISKVLKCKKDVILKVRCKNIKAIKLYKKLGFKKIDKTGTIDGTDAFLMKFNKRG